MSRSTAATPSTADDDRPVQYTFDDDPDDDDDDSDESSAEDVFAFLPPTTADSAAPPSLQYPAPTYDPATPVRVSLPSAGGKEDVRPESFAQSMSEEGSIK